MASHEGVGHRGSILLYRLASEDDAHTQPASSSASSRDSAQLLPPPNPKPLAGSQRNSTVSTYSFVNLDSKYPLSNRDGAFPTFPRIFVPYEYDLAMDELDPLDEEDLMHDPTAKGYMKTSFSWRGALNVVVLVSLILGLLSLFFLYPVLTFFRNEARNARINGNIHINGTGQAPVLFQMPDLIDPTTPDEARTRVGYDSLKYDLVFSDEFNTDGRTFYPGDDPFWEAVDLWYGVTGDIEWYDPSQVTTSNGSLVITMDSADTLQSGLTQGSTAPLTTAENHGLSYRSGMLQSWNKVCFTGGYIEVSVVLPGANAEATGYLEKTTAYVKFSNSGQAHGPWGTSLGRGTLRQRMGCGHIRGYNSCDVGTFPNQTNKDGLGPAAALHSDASRAKYNYELSWLSGQRASACSCPDSDHPGPSPSVGRGAPEIDIFEAEHSKDTPTGHVVSQSAQFAPFTADYVYLNATTDQWEIFSPNVTRPNNYRGSAVQQAVSGIVSLRDDMFQGSFEYNSDPNNPSDGYIIWQVDGVQSHRMGAAAVSPDQGPTGSGVGQRLIPVEPMSIVLNLGMSQNWQNIDFSTLTFPAEFLIDYVRVYQRRGAQNVGCNPKDYPTKEYIDNHSEAYTNANTTTWNWEKPKNSRVGFFIF
ncbi:hypothetical protein H0H87_001844 [Tephrocybe sp. NHM501043]|nr:hypothetical protein H0H87_001844 [Tephrocybe sp. NHM501043]